MLLNKKKNILSHKTGAIIKSTLEGSGLHGLHQSELNNMPPANSPLVAQYKELIREQDVKIQYLSQSNEALQQEKELFEVCADYKQ